MVTMLSPKRVFVYQTVLFVLLQPITHGFQSSVRHQYDANILSRTMIVEQRLAALTAKRAGSLNDDVVVVERSEKKKRKGGTTSLIAAKGVALAAISWSATSARGLARVAPASPSSTTATETTWATATRDRVAEKVKDILKNRVAEKGKEILENPRSKTVAFALVGATAGVALGRTLVFSDDDNDDDDDGGVNEAKFEALMGSSSEDSTSSTVEASSVRERFVEEISERTRERFVEETLARLESEKRRSPPTYLDSLMVETERSPMSSSATYPPSYLDSISSSLSSEATTVASPGDAQGTDVVAVPSREVDAEADEDETTSSAIVARYDAMPILERIIAVVTDGFRATTEILVALLESIVTFFKSLVAP